MKLYRKNPRQITDKQFTDLGGSLSRLGDLGGIVHDLNSDEIIGGNQRSRVFDINQCDIQLIEQYLEPDEQGTIGLGFVIWKGKKYAYRQVRWTPRQCEEANIRANAAGGDWDLDDLANEWELPDLLEWGIDKSKLGLMATSKEFDFSSLPSEDRAPFRQMTFTLHDTQAEQVEAALKASIAMGAFIDSPNENSNGNALARICEIFLGENGNG